MKNDMDEEKCVLRIAIYPIETNVYMGCVKNEARQKHMEMYLSVVLLLSRFDIRLNYRMMEQKQTNKKII